MKGYILTFEQKQKIQGVFFTENIFFNCIKDINETWFLFLSQQDIELLPTEYQYLLQLPQAEYVPPVYESPYLN